MVFLWNKKGKIPLFPHSCHSVFNLSLYIGMQSVDGSLQTAGLLRKDGKTQPQAQRQMGSVLPEPESRVGKLDCWEIFRGKKRPGPGFRGEPRTQRQRVPEVHYPVTLCLSLRAGSSVISPEAL